MLDSKQIYATDNNDYDDDFSILFPNKKYDNRGSE